MDIARVTLFCLLCVISEQVEWGLFSSGVTDMTDYTIPNPGSVTRVNFPLNLITFVPSNYFINLPILDMIQLQGNLISNISDLAFSGVPTVRVIHLYDNKLSVVRELMFKGQYIKFNGSKNTPS